tara:strand:- start:480 stop:650 length:171 start_codon:yes stop_codon:yes gene_type:complete
MSTQKGTVLVFKEGATDGEIREALKKIEDILDNDPDFPPTINEFENKWGGPVWYTP